VIVGRGSAYYLGNRSDVFHVFIYAPFDEKVRRLIAGVRARVKLHSLSRRSTATAQHSSSNISPWTGPTGSSFN